MIIEISRNNRYCGVTVGSLLKSLSLSTKMIRKLKYTDNGITVNGVRVTVRYTLCEGDVLALSVEDSEPSKSAMPSEIPVDIVYEDDEIIVADKPPFMPTHPSHGHHDDTLANALASIFAKRGVPFVFRPINRLDRNTSGLVIVAKNKFSAASMTKAMKEKHIKKTYIAFLEGSLEDPSITINYMGEKFGVIDAPICRSEKSIIVRRVCSPDEEGAEAALTYYRILNRCDKCTEVEIRPQTGRTHQLRVHFAHLGHPIIGDDMYGRASKIIPRHALHAARLEFNAPESLGNAESGGKWLTLTSPLPADIAEVKKTFFG